MGGIEGGCERFPRGSEHGSWCRRRRRTAAVWEVIGDTWRIARVSTALCDRRVLASDERIDAKISMLPVLRLCAPQ